MRGKEFRFEDSSVLDSKLTDTEDSGREDIESDASLGRVDKGREHDSHKGVHKAHHFTHIRDGSAGDVGDGRFADEVCGSHLGIHKDTDDDSEY